MQVRITALATEAEASTDTGVPALTIELIKTGDNNNQLTLEAFITGVVSGNSDNYKLYVNIVDDGGGFFHIDFYSTSDRSTTLVAHTATYNGTGSQSIVADGGSGLGGQLTIAAVVAVDSDITLQWPIPD